MKCFYCDQPLDFSSMHVDHVLPESLTNDPKKLEAVLREYEIIENYPGFSLDALSNKVLSHGASCNLRKSNTIFPKQATLFYLSITHKRLPKVLAELERLNTIAERGNALGGLGRLLEKGQISDAEVGEILTQWEFRSTLDEPLVVTFGLNFAETMQMRGLQISGPSAYANACDKFEAELVGAIRSVTDHSFHYAEASARNGETLSVRLVFPALDLTDVDTLLLGSISAVMPWWELLEVTNFYRVYGCRYREVIDPPGARDDQHAG
ncbi:MAG: HNH endonuclease [Acidobacteriota bacterium]